MPSVWMLRRLDGKQSLETLPQAVRNAGVTVDKLVSGTIAAGWERVGSSDARRAFADIGRWCRGRQEDR
jgi:hypothetical protein